ncbi:MAG TPA: hypothetical protein VEQ38_22295 [Verrucomicrobiae bacterium]|nr:hypothetical protein [Verrucomicrobiae bacterium]
MKFEIGNSAVRTSPQLPGRFDDELDFSLLIVFAEPIAHDIGSKAAAKIDPSQGTLDLRQVRA